MLTLNKETLAVLQADINIKSDELVRLDIQEMQTKADLNSALAAITQTTLTIAALPERLQIIQRLEREIIGQGERIRTEKEQLNPLETESKTIEAEIRALQEEFLDINIGNYSKKLIEDQVLASSVDVILANRNTLSKNEEQLKSLVWRITQQEALNSEISTFIGQGLDIVNKDRNRTNCPLCEQNFKTHQDLVKRIAGNKALDNLLKGLIADKNLLEQESTVIQLLIDSATQQLLRYFEGKIRDKQAQLVAVSDQVKTITKTIASFEENLKVMQNDLREVLMQQVGLSNEEYERELKYNLKTFKKTEDRLNALLKNQSQDKNTLSDLLAKMRDEVKLFEENIATLEKSEKYVAVRAWFRSNFSTEDVSFEVLQNEFTQNDGIIKEYFDKASTLRTELEILTLE
ncbi:MAG: hypothetical protein EOP48_26680, partial [Sphingobacteriales bacterium]